jgi:gliding motility-associated-like protein
MIPDYDLPIGDFGPKCIDTAFGKVLVQEVIAAFDVKEDKKPEFCFKNTSTGAIKYKWRFEDLDGYHYSEEENPCYNWGERIGEYEVCLEAENALGCKDTVCVTINNNFIAKIVPYNVFTPDTEDEFNKTFVIEVEGEEEYEIKIYNRWGELVFESTDSDVHWDGTVMNKGKLCPQGTYFYIINYKLKNREENDGLDPISGTVTLIRQ